MAKITDLVAELARPAVAEAGCELWDVEYVREAGAWFLRLYIDKEGGVDILDCERVSRAVSELLDEADPIEGSYTFEASVRFCPLSGQSCDREAVQGPRGPEGVCRRPGGVRPGQRRDYGHCGRRGDGFPKKRGRSMPAAD